LKRHWLGAAWISSSVGGFSQWNFNEFALLLLGLTRQLPKQVKAQQIQGGQIC
jgi:hypothetical protein